MPASEVQLTHVRFIVFLVCDGRFFKYQSNSNRGSFNLVRATLLYCEGSYISVSYIDRILCEFIYYLCMKQQSGIVQQSTNYTIIIDLALPADRFW